MSTMVFVENITPRKRLLYEARMRLYRNLHWSGHECLEDVISEWRHKRQFEECIQYYQNTSDRALERLCREVEKSWLKKPTLQS